MWPTNDFSDKSIEEMILHLEIEHFILDHFDAETLKLADELELL